MAPPKVEQRDQESNVFAFPYEPYAIQVDLMQQIWRTLDNRHVGIFESPTGTGKSMSLICGALSWLRKHTDPNGVFLSKGSPPPSGNGEPSTKDTDKTDTSGAQHEPAWLQQFVKQDAQRQLESKQSQVQHVLQEIETIRRESAKELKKRKSLYAYREKLDHGPSAKRLKQPAKLHDNNPSDGREEEHLVDAYDSDQLTVDADHDSEDEDSTSNKWRPQEQPDYGIIKIIYCSRTHSQISQFMHEITKTAFGQNVRCVSLGSRKNLCVHPRVAKLSSEVQITDQCLEMLQKKASASKSASKKCPYYDHKLLGHFTNHALAHVQDIEELHQLGQEMSACAYYGVRQSIPLAQVIGMPYSMLLSKDTRESLGIELDGNIVILDEAHNIVEAVNQTYSVCITSKELVLGRRALWNYFSKYEKRFKGRNSFYIKQLLSVLELLAKFLRQKPRKPVSSENDAATNAKMLMINDFLFAARIDHFNMFKIVQYLQQSNLHKKLLGFLDMENAAEDTSKQSDDEYKSKNLSPLRGVEAFLLSLTNAETDGRVLVQYHDIAAGQEALIKFLMLNPSTQFQEIVDKSWSVILAGGTMQPVAQVIDQLFPQLRPEEIDLFSCGHVIPPSNLLGFSVSCGPTKEHLEFTFNRRNRLESIDELGRVLINVSRIVPGGIVVFFPSYRFEEQVVGRWQQTQQFVQLHKLKSIFREPKRSEELARVLDDYSQCCQRQQSSGAVLLSVVGGKMSEGINFSDDLARCIVMVGLPYPNTRDPELVEKMNAMEKRKTGSGRELYENICMKAVNQSIGRAIRHRNDYATILLVDHRYSYPSIRKRLPRWIQDRVVPAGTAESFGQIYSQLGQFYRAKRINVLE